MTRIRHILNPRARGRRGALLILTVWLIILLTVMAYSLSYEMRIGLKMTGNGRRRIQALGLARAGLAQATTDLRNNQFLKYAQGKDNNDHLKDIWALTEDKTDVELGDGTYTVRIVDESGKLDLNLVRPDWRYAIEYLLKNVCDQNEEEAELMSNALIDYLDADNRPVTGEDVTEGEFYTAAAWQRFGSQLPQGWVFRPKNDRMQSVDELLEIPGFTREILYGESGKVPVDPIDRLEMKEKSTALVDYVTVGRTGKININTAPVEVYAALLSIPGQGRVDVRRPAEALDDLRKDLLNKRGKEAVGFTNIREQLVQAKMDSVLRDGLAQLPIEVYSREFTIISRGTVGSVSQTLEAHVMIALQSYTLESENERGEEYMHDYKAMGFLKNQPDLIFDPFVRVIQMKQY